MRVLFLLLCLSALAGCAVEPVEARMRWAVPIATTCISVKKPATAAPLLVAAVAVVIKGRCDESEC